MPDALALFAQRILVDGVVADQHLVDVANDRFIGPAGAGVGAGDGFAERIHDPNFFLGVAHILGGWGDILPIVGQGESLFVFAVPVDRKDFFGLAGRGVWNSRAPCSRGSTRHRAAARRGFISFFDPFGVDDLRQVPELGFHECLIAFAILDHFSRIGVRRRSIESGDKIFPQCGGPDEDLLFLLVVQIFPGVADVVAQVLGFLLHQFGPIAVGMLRAAQQGIKRVAGGRNFPFRLNVCFVHLAAGDRIRHESDQHYQTAQDPEVLFLDDHEKLLELVHDSRRVCGAWRVAL